MKSTDKKSTWYVMFQGLDVGAVWQSVAMGPSIFQVERVCLNKYVFFKASVWRVDNVMSNWHVLGNSKHKGIFRRRVTMAVWVTRAGVCRLNGLLCWQKTGNDEVKKTVGLRLTYTILFQFSFAISSFYIFWLIFSFPAYMRMTLGRTVLQKLPWI